MSSRAGVAVAVVLLLVLGGGTVWLFSKPNDEEPEAVAEAEAEREEEVEEPIGDWEYVFGDPADGPDKRALRDVKAERWDRERPFRGPDRERRGPPGERFRQRRVDITPLGLEPVTLDGERIHDGLRLGRDEFRACMAEAGGREAFRRAFAGDRATPPMVRFDVSGAGALTPGTLTFDPPIPAELEPCFAGMFRQLDVGPVGGDGAHVEMELGTGGRRRRGGGGGDGGVAERRRDRPEGGGRGDREGRGEPGWRGDGEGGEPGEGRDPDGTRSGGRELGERAPAPQVH